MPCEFKLTLNDDWEKNYGPKSRSEAGLGLLFQRKWTNIVRGCTFPGRLAQDSSIEGDVKSFRTAEFRSWTCGLTDHKKLKGWACWMSRSPRLAASSFGWSEFCEIQILKEIGITKLHNFANAACPQVQMKCTFPSDQLPSSPSSNPHTSILKKKIYLSNRIEFGSIPNFLP